MSKLAPMDLAFLLLESSNNQMHMAAYQILKIPARQTAGFVPKLLAAYRGSEVAKPFNQQLKWMSKSVASWETVPVDLQFHVRHVAVPPPGTLQQFYQLVAFLNAPLLDRNRPLWECYVIEGLEDNQCAVFIKIHHALVDGGGGLKLFHNSMNTTAANKSIRALWTPSAEKPAKRASAAGQSQLNALMKSLNALPGGMRSISAELVDLGAQTLRMKPKVTRLPFGADRCAFNHSPQSSERRYSSCELDVARVKALAKASGTTVNDVVMTVIDHSLHRYLMEHKEPNKQALVAMMPMSMRKPGDETPGNQVSAELVEMGEPKATLSQRLAQISQSTSTVKERGQRLPSAVRQVMSLVTAGSGSLLQLSPLLQDMPSFNLVISNMIGPREQLYVGGASLVSFGGLPIVPPGAGLNVTFATVHNTLGLAVGSAPEALADPKRLTDLMLESFAQLEKLSKPTSAARKKAKR